LQRILLSWRQALVADNFQCDRHDLVG
jgi:hypothetical protein